MDAKIASSMSVKSAIRSLKDERPKVIFLAEQHLTSPSLYYADLLSILKKEFPELDCLLLEKPDEYSSDFELILKNKTDLVKDRMLVYLSRLIKRASRLGLAISPGDPAQFSHGDNLSTAAFDRRNRGIAKKIGGLLELGAGRRPACHQIVMLIGSNHISDLAKVTTTVPDILRESKVASRGWWKFG